MEQAGNIFFLNTSPVSSEPQYITRLEGSTAKKALFSPFSPMDTERTQVQSDMATPKRRLSLNMDESTQSPFHLDADTGYGESVSSCSSVESSLNGGLSMECSSDLRVTTTRSPLGELDSNTPSGGTVCKRRTLQARRLKRRPSSLIAEECKRNSLQENLPLDIVSAPIENSAFKIPSLSTHHTTRPSSLPALTQSQPSGDSWLTQSYQSSRKSWIRQISSPLERMTLMSPTGQPTEAHPFSFESHPSTSSTHSLPHRSTSLTSESDGYFSEIEVFENEQATNSPSDTIKTLFNAPLSRTNDSIQEFSTNKENGLPCPTPVRPMSFQRSDSCSQISTNLRRSAVKNRASLKRSSPSSELAHPHPTKRPPLPFFHCSNSQDSPVTATNPPTPTSRNTLKGRSLLRSQSYCTPIGGDGMITSLSPGDGEALIGDESKPCALPLVRGSCTELKCISPETLSKLVAGEYKDVVDTFSIIDCRYPYEYQGGHIQGAVNIWEKGELLQKFFSNPVHPKENERTIYVFHCEFSSKRGPEMCRFLREIDRKKNGLEYFPKLYYPELYLLDGGYKAFYQTLGHFCEPKTYCLMLDENHKEELRHFKQRARSWTGDSIIHTRRQVPSRCRRRNTMYFSNRSDSKCHNSSASPTGRTDTENMS